MDSMGNRVFTEAEKDFFGTQRVGRIATADPQGTPDVAPVTFRIRTDGAVEIGGFDQTKTIKWRNVRASGKAAFVADDLMSVDPWRPRGVKVRGAAEALDRDGTLVIRITPATVWSWGINTGADKRFRNVERREVPGT